jgi:hypothetical protein
MSDSSPLDDPLLSESQVLWVFITFGWFIVGGVALATGRLTFGVGALLLGGGSSYRIYNPG